MDTSKILTSIIIAIIIAFVLSTSSCTTSKESIKYEEIYLFSKDKNEASLQIQSDN